ncbi:cyclin B [Tanacetum coccineum]
MTSSVDHPQPIIALGETRNLDIINPDYRLTGVCNKPFTKAQSVANHTITEKALELLSLLATTKPKDHVIINIDEFDNNNEIAQNDWLIQLHSNCRFMPETLYLTINIVDRYLSLTTIARIELQLVGIGALLISSKYDEILLGYGSRLARIRCEYVSL